MPSRIDGVAIFPVLQKERHAGEYDEMLEAWEGFKLAWGKRCYGRETSVALPPNLKNSANLPHVPPPPHQMRNAGTDLRRLSAPTPIIGPRNRSMDELWFLLLFSRSTQSPKIDSCAFGSLRFGNDKISRRLIMG